MSFLTPSYLLFFPAVAVFYFLLPRRTQNPWLLLCSWAFYLYAGPRYFPFLLFAILSTYAAGLAIAKRRRKLLLALALGANVGVLFAFKYLDFAAGLLNRVLALFQLDAVLPGFELILPLGISFYLFQAMGYVIDVYRGKREAQRDFVRYALFISFFPSLLSGPIGRSDQLLPQFDQPHAFSYDRMRSGLIRFLWGAFQKLVVADRLSLWLAPAFANPGSYSTGQLWFAAAAFSIQIYCDFSAYSDMACGCAEVMGFQLIQNFRTPYFSRSIQEFWRRWHISLSTWFRDYLYIPLGGSRKGAARKYLNVLIVFAVSGLWHGAALTFVVWGLLNGIYQVVGGITLPARRAVRRVLHMGEDAKITVLWQMLCTFILATAAWVFFKAGSLTSALSLLGGMVIPRAGAGLTLTGGLRELSVTAVALLVVLAHDIWSLRTDIPTRLVKGNRALRWILCLGMLMAVLVFGVYGPGYDAQDFIYFKF